MILSIKDMENEYTISSVFGRLTQTSQCPEGKFLESKLKENIILHTGTTIVIERTWQRGGGQEYSAFR